MDPSTLRDELRAIRSLMSESQEWLSGTWLHQLGWGCLTAVGLAGTWYASWSGSGRLVPWLWLGVLVFGWTGSLLVERMGPRRRVHNAASRAFGGIWIGTGLALTLTGTVAVWSGAVEPAALPGMLCVIFGGGYFASASLAGLAWMRWLSAAWWIGGVALLWWPGPHALLLMAALVLLLEVAPALALRGMEGVGSREVAP